MSFAIAKGKINATLIEKSGIYVISTGLNP